ncbi:MAG: VIT family protein [Chitinophagaceae bacterium]|nr:VIT family protein [Oligoflexus sp.]
MSVKDSRIVPKTENHKNERTNWLRAAVLGANDGLLSTASLIIGVAASHAERSQILTAGLAALVAGALSMAAGEYVSVSSQADTEKADLAKERAELNDSPESELLELARIYMTRGLEEGLAVAVAKQLMAFDALGSHARDELGINDRSIAKPIQAAFSSAGSFAVGAILPLLLSIFLPMSALMYGVGISTVLFLAALGTTAAKAGGAPLSKGAIRVAFWGLIAMAVTAGVGAMSGKTF